MLKLLSEVEWAECSPFVSGLVWGGVKGVSEASKAFHGESGGVATIGEGSLLVA